MSIRENVSRVLFFGLLLTMLIAPIGYAATNSQTANHNDAKFTLLQTEDTDQPVMTIACNTVDESSGGGCGG